MSDTTAGDAPAIKFTAKALGPVSVFLSQTDIRYYLNGICVMPNPGRGGCFIVGCDGRRLAMWHDPDGRCTEQKVLTVSKQLISASRKKGMSEGVVCLEGGHLVLKNADGEEVFIQAGNPEIELKEHHQYPDVWRVIPDQKKLAPGLHGAVAGAFLEDIGKAAKMLSTGGKWGHGHAVWHYSNGTDGNGSVLTRFARAPEMVVVTMPMREGIKGAALPAAFSSRPVMATASFACDDMGREVADLRAGR